MRLRPATIVMVAAAATGACDAGSGGTRDAGSGGTRGPAGTLMPPAGAAADFVLTDTDGRPFSFQKETRGSVAILFFGFTNCPDVCPVHMANLAAVLDELPSEVSRQVKVIFITVDPERDTPTRLREWLDQFDESFIGLTGDREHVNRIQVDLGLPASIVRMDEHGTANVGHASHVMVFAKERDRRYVYPFGTRQRDWAREIPLLVEGAPPSGRTGVEPRAAEDG
jgi:protein SCO1/2